MFAPMLLKGYAAKIARKAESPRLTLLKFSANSEGVAKETYLEHG
jgi:hypothetical protein